MCVYVYVYMYVCMCFICVYVCVYMCMCMCMCMCVYIHTCINFVCHVQMSNNIYKKPRHLLTKKLYFGFFQNI